MNKFSVVTAVAVAFVLVAEAAKKPEPAVTENYDWRDGVADLALEGRGFPKDAAPYVRLPERFKGVVTPSVWGLSQTSIGMNARFVTDSREIVVRWTVRPKIECPPTFTFAMFAGVDVYRRGADGAWQHVSVGAPDRASGAGELRVRWTPGEECMIYLPVRTCPQAFSVGVLKGSSFAAPKAHAFAKPVVHYGTSIVNGAAASRPGLIFPAIMGRCLDAEVIDLGFSGAGKMELPMADLVAEIEASLYIIDCDWNMSVDLQKQNYLPFVKRLKELRPDTPVLLCGGCTERPVPMKQETYARGVYDQLKAEDPVKWANWGFLSGVEMLPNDSDCTLDHCHPNDWGFAQMARVYAGAARALLVPGLTSNRSVERPDNLIHGPYPLLVTPWTEDAKLDVEVLAKEAEYVNGCGVGGIIWPTAGEVIGNLSAAEFEDGLRALAKRAVEKGFSARITAICPGKTSADAVERVKLVQKIADETGAKMAILARPPNDGTNQTIIAAHYRALAQVTRLPVIIQTFNGSKTAPQPDVDLVVKLSAEYPDIYGYVKEESPGLKVNGRMAELLKHKEIKTVLSGWGGKGWMFQGTKIGTRGVISQRPAYAGLFTRVYNLICEGRMPDDPELASTYARYLYMCNLGDTFTETDDNFRGPHLYVLQKLGIFRNRLTRDGKGKVTDYAMTDLEKLEIEQRMKYCGLIK